MDRRRHILPVTQRPRNLSAATAVLVVLTALALNSGPSGSTPAGVDDSWTDSGLAVRMVVAMTAAARDWKHPSSPRSFDALLDQVRPDGGVRLAAAPTPLEPECCRHDDPRLLEPLLDLPPPTV